MALCPFATQKLIAPPASDPLITPRVAVLHVDAGGSGSLFDYFKNRSGGIESHFHIKWSGEIEQYRDTAYQADANLGANDFGISIETQGFAGGTWTKRQLRSIKRLLLWLNATHNIPLRECDGPFGSGVGYHVQFGAPGPWTPVAKSCPGPMRIVQFNEDLVPWLEAQADPPAPKPRVSLTVVTANLWRENPAITADLATLARSHAHIIGCNEAQKFMRELGSVPGYRLHVAPAAIHNPILVREDIIVTGTGYRTISKAVGESPERSAFYVTYLYRGQKRAHVNTHFNSHVQKGLTEPHDLPRVKEFIAGQQAVTALVKGLQAEGYRVTVTGDLNWSWTGGVRQWRFAPKRVFGQIGFKAQFEHPTNPRRRPRGDRRQIEYVLYHPADLTVVSQHYVKGEHSDHPFHQVTFAVKGL